METQLAVTAEVGWDGWVPNKRLVLLLLAIIAIAAFSGWAVAYFEHRGRVERAAAAALVEARRPGIRLAAIVRQCDAAALVFLDGQAERVLRVPDDSWRERLAIHLEGGAYEATNQVGLGLSFPLIRLSRDGETRLELMILGNRIKAVDPEVNGEYLIDPALASAILNLQIVETDDA